MARTILFKTCNYFVVISFISILSFGSCEIKCGSSIHSVEVLNETFNENDAFKRVDFKVFGEHILSDLQLKVTHTNGEKDSICTNFENYSVDEVSANLTEGYFVLKYKIFKEVQLNDLYVCLPCVRNSSTVSWHHQGSNVVVRIKEGLAKKNSPLDERQSK